jgi:hypothetical protein
MNQTSINVLDPVSASVWDRSQALIAAVWSARRPHSVTVPLRLMGSSGDGSRAHARTVTDDA